MLLYYTFKVLIYILMILQTSDGLCRLKSIAGIFNKDLIFDNL